MLSGVGGWDPTVFRGRKDGVLSGVGGWGPTVFRGRKEGGRGLRVLLEIESGWKEPQQML